MTASLPGFWQISRLHIAALDALSRHRTLTDHESRTLERMIGRYHRLLPGLKSTIIKSRHRTARLERIAAQEGICV